MYVTSSKFSDIHHNNVMLVTCWSVYEGFDQGQQLFNLITGTRREDHVHGLAMFYKHNNGCCEHCHICLSIVPSHCAKFGPY